MIELCDAMLGFYPREIAKIDSRIERFRKIRTNGNDGRNRSGRDGFC